MDDLQREPELQPTGGPSAADPERVLRGDLPEPRPGSAADPSTRLWDQAQAVLGAGLWSVSQGARSYPEGLFPLLAESGEGAWLTDTNGRRYVDWMMGWGTSILGYRNATVERAVIDQLRKSGPLLPLLHPLEVETARLLRSLIPCAERVAFGKNGSDVLAIAVRIARAATGRSGVLVCGYHGFHDWYMASVPGCEGIPHSQGSLVTELPFNDVDGTRALFEEHGEHIACVVLEPAGHREPAPGFLQELRRLCLKSGALLIFDEVMTALRLGRGGAQERYGVVPDLACLGKAMANGFALSALVGSRDVMEVIARVGYGLTFRGELTALAAAKATLEFVREHPVAEHLESVGCDLRERFAEACSSAGIAAELIGPAPRMTLSFAPAGGLTPLGLQTLMIQECLKHGVLTNGLLLPSFAHDAQTLDRTQRAFEAGAETLARAVDARSLDSFLHMNAHQEAYRDDPLQEQVESDQRC